MADTVVELCSELQSEEPTAKKRRSDADDTSPSGPPTPVPVEQPLEGRTWVELHPFGASDATRIDRCPPLPALPEPALRRTQDLRASAPVVRRPLDLSGLLRGWFYEQPTVIKPLVIEEDEWTGRWRRRTDDSAVLLQVLLDEDLDEEDLVIRQLGQARDRPAWQHLAVMGASCLAMLTLAFVLYVVVVHW